MQLYLAKCGKLAELRTVIVQDNSQCANRAPNCQIGITSYPEGLVIPYKLIRFRPSGVRDSANTFHTSDAEMAELQQLCGSLSSIASSDCVGHRYRGLIRHQNTKKLQKQRQIAFQRVGCRSVAM